MAQEDWAEWIEPWSWTVEAKNTSTKNIAQPSCASTSTMLSGFAIDNASEVAALIIGTIITLCLVQRERSDFKKYYWYIAVAEGIFNAVLWLVSNLITAHFIQRATGYQDVPREELMLLFCTRPSILMALSVLTLLIPLFEKWGPFDTEQSQLKTIRRKSNEVRQYLAQAVLSNLIYAALVQILAAVYIFKAANAGRLKDFYHVGNLTPYWRGVPTQIMYAGAILWTSMFIPSVLSLAILIPFMAQKVKHEGREQKRKLKKKKWLNRFFRYIAYLEAERDHEIELRQKEEAENGEETTHTFMAWLRFKSIGVLQIFQPVYLAFYQLFYEEWLFVAEHTETEQQAITEGSVRSSESMTEREVLEEISVQRLQDELETKRVDFNEANRKRLTYIVLALWTINYIGQWLFWSGFVESMGSR
ncbi:MAG: hypothetical protein LQ342_000155 [Letrouitia transgressa]|nr:MAG: hypothetical protein LQ342_000155 [Letrouitia transgressa]